MEKQINSHIQMPKFILSRFENEKHGLYYYDIIGGYIAHGHARTINTEKGYFSESVEKILNNVIEQPFSRLLHYIDKIDFDSIGFHLENGFEETTKSFLNALLARSPNTYNTLKKSSIFLQLLNQQSQHDLSVLTSIREAEKIDFFKDYFPTFTVNRTQTPFVLSVCGFYWFNNGKNINFPISPQLAISLVNEEILTRLIKDDMIRMYVVNKETEVDRLNHFAYLEQKNLGYGRIVAPIKKALEEMQTGKDII